MMKKITLILIVFILYSFFANDQLHAQVLTPLPSGSHAIYTNFGLDPSFAATLGYARGFYNSKFKREMMLTSEISLPIKFDTHDYRLKLGGQTLLYRVGRFDCWGALSFISRGTKNSIHNAHSLGADITFLTGFNFKHWFITGEFGFDRSILMHLNHSTWYKTYFYTDAKDGWYRNTASHFNFGFRSGFSVKRFEFTIRAGIQKAKSIIDPLVPFFGVLGLNYRL